MKKALWGAMMAAAGIYSGSAAAGTEIYGVVDTGLEYVRNVNAAGDSVLKMPTVTASTPSGIGFRGTEDLGGGLKTIFNLESGYAVDTGAAQQGARLFGRQAYVGLQGDFGAVTLGRMYNMTYLASGQANVMAGHIQSLIVFDGYLPNARSDNAIGYMGRFSGFKIGATYSLGRDAASSGGGPSATNCAGEVAGDSKACKQWTALVGYDSNRFGFANAYDILYGGPGAANGLTSSNFYDQRVTLNGYVILDGTKLGMGVIDRQTQTAVKVQSDIFFANFSHPFAGSWVLDGQVARINLRNSPDDSTLYVARITYRLSKRTALYSSLAQTRNSGRATRPVESGGVTGPGMSQTGLMMGMRHSF